MPIMIRTQVSRVKIIKKCIIMKKITFLTGAILVLLTFISCEREGVLYQLSDKIEASFPSTIVNISMLASDGNQIEIEMWRGNTKGAVSVPVTITNSTGGVFTPLKNAFDFADGENRAYLKFSYPDINNFGGEKYIIDVSITDENQVSKGGFRTIRITAQRKLTFQSIGTGLFTSEFFEDSWSQPVEKAIEAEYYRLPNLYYTNYPIEFSINNGVVTYAKQPMGYIHSTYGMISWDPRSSSGSSKVGKKITFIVDFRVTAGSFGVYNEVLDLP
jgi:hypothetical protein